METTTKHFRVVDEDKIDEVYDKILEILVMSDITIYEALGILECVKQDILYEDDD